jgi:RimJ/RimL family protein N-acetyltransferase
MSRRKIAGGHESLTLRPTYPIETERLLLRPLETGDLDAMHAIQSLPEVSRYLYWEPRSRAEVEEFIASSSASLEEEGDKLRLAVVLRESGAVIGDVVLVWVSREHKQGEIGFGFDPAHQGKGYATEAAVEILRLGFEGAHLHRIVGRCDDRNEASTRVMERLGMRREAHLLENEFVKGEWQGEIVYAMLASEWPKTVSGLKQSRP